MFRLATKKELKRYLTIAVIVIITQSVLLDYFIFAKQNIPRDIFNTENKQIQSCGYEYAYNRQTDRADYYLDFDYTFHNYSSESTIVLHDMRVEDVPPFLHFNIVELRQKLLDDSDMFNYTLHLAKARHDISRFYFLPGDKELAEAIIKHLKIKPYAVVLDRVVPENVYDMDIPKGAGVAIYDSGPSQDGSKFVAKIGGSPHFKSVRYSGSQKG